LVTLLSSLSPPCGERVPSESEEDFVLATLSPFHGEREKKGEFLLD
jgi:hypothetical protein